MKVTVACQICGTTLTIAEGPNLSSVDAENYQQSCYCDIVTNGIVDGQQNIQAILTNE